MKQNNNIPSDNDVMAIAGVVFILIGAGIPVAVITVLLSQGRWILDILKDPSNAPRAYYLANCIRGLAFGVCPGMGLLLIVAGIMILRLQKGWCVKKDGVETQLIDRHIQGFK